MSMSTIKIEFYVLAMLALVFLSSCAEPADSMRTEDNSSRAVSESNQVEPIILDWIQEKEKTGFIPVATDEPPALASRIDVSNELLGVWYLDTESAGVYLAANNFMAPTNRLYRRSKVDVLEVLDGWGRISKYYDGTVEGLPGRHVARWVDMKGLSRIQPEKIDQPKISVDPRIEGLPEIGQGGVLLRDVQILHAAARFYIETGQARKIEYGDKSVNRAGTYYLNFGGPKNHFFKVADIPDLERRIKEMMQ